MALHPGGTQRHGGDVGGDAEMVAGEADGLDAIGIELAEALHLQQAQILEGDRIAGRAGIEHHVLGAALGLEEGDDVLDLGERRHAGGDVDLAGVVAAEPALELEIQVRRRGDLDEVGLQLRDLDRRGEVPDRGGVDDALGLAIALQLGVLVDGELQKFPVLAIGSSVGVRRHRMRRVVFRRRQQFTVVALLEFDSVHSADLRRDADHLLGDVHIALVITTNFGNELGHLKNPQFATKSFRGCETLPRRRRGDKRARDQVFASAAPNCSRFGMTLLAAITDCSAAVLFATQHANRSSRRAGGRRVGRALRHAGACARCAH